MTEEKVLCRGDSVETYLTGEGKGRLVKALLLGVTNVGADNPGERETMVLGLCELDSELFCLDSELATYGVLNFCHGGVEVCGGEGMHCRVEKTMMVREGTGKPFIDTRQETRPGRGQPLKHSHLRSAIGTIIRISSPISYMASSVTRHITYHRFRVRQPLQKRAHELSARLGREEKGRCSR